MKNFGTISSTAATARTNSIERVLPTSISLRLYLELMIKYNQLPSTLMNQQDVAKLLDSITVVPETASPRQVLELPPASESRPTMPEIISRFIETQLQSSQDYRQLNCIALGHRLVTPKSMSALRSNNKVECYYLNTLHSYFATVAWAQLARALGESIIRHLFSRPMFYPCGSGCFIQVCGMPLAEHIRQTQLTTGSYSINPRELFGSSGNHSNNGNYPRLIQQQHQQAKVVRASELIPRYMIFYSSKCNRRAGLPPNNLFSKRATSANDLLTDLLGPKPSTIITRLSMLGESTFDVESESDGCILAVLDCALQAYRRLPVGYILNAVCPPTEYQLANQKKSSSEYNSSARRRVHTYIPNNISNSVKALETQPPHSTSKCMGLEFEPTNSISTSVNALELFDIIETSQTHPLNSNFNCMDLEPQPTNGISNNINAVKIQPAKSICYSVENEPQPPTTISDCMDLEIQTRNSITDSIDTLQTQPPDIISDAAETLESQPSNSIINSTETIETQPLNSISESIDFGDEAPVAATELTREKTTLAPATVWKSVSELCPRQGKKKRKRGCRGGIANRLKKMRENHWNATEIALLPPTCSLTELTTPLTHQPSNGSEIENVQANRTTPIRRPLVLVGERLLRRTVSSMRRAAKVTESTLAFDTQDQHAEVGIEQSLKAHNQEHELYSMVIPTPEFIYEVSTGSASEPRVEKTCVSAGTLLLSGAVGSLGDSHDGLTQHLCKRPLYSAYTVDSASLKTHTAVNVTSNKETSVPYLYEQQKTADSSKKQKISKQLEFPDCDFLSLRTPHDSVSRFCTCIVRHLFPRSVVWGSRRNENAILSSVDKFVRLDRYETMTVEEACRGIQLSNIPWIGHVRTAQAQARLRRFMMWLFVRVVIPLLSSSFYATEGEGSGRETLYFRRRVWSRLVRHGRNQMKSHFIEVELGRTMQCQGRSPALLPAAVKKLPSVRFLPKRNSLRPITNFRRGTRNSTDVPTNGSGNNSIGIDLGTAPSNSALYNCLHVLRHCASREPVRTGFGIMHMDDVFAKIKHFKMTLTRKAPTTSSVTGTSITGTNKFAVPTQMHSLPKIYAATLDLEKCYDNVDTAQLYDLVRLLLDDRRVEGKEHFHGPCDERLVLHRYSVTRYIKSLERSVSRTVRHVATEGDMISAKEATLGLSLRYPHSLLGDGVVHSHVSRADTLRVLRQHLFAHTVRLPAGRGDPTECADNQAWRQKGFLPFTQVKGIPQGSVVSPVLCNLYYGHAEREIFSGDAALSLGERTLVLRLMDDYLVLSTDKAAVLHFLRVAHSAFEKFGGGVNARKTRVNFEAEVEQGGVSVNLEQIAGPLLPWCGLLIDTVMLEVRPGFERLLSLPLRASVGLEARQPGTALRRAIKGFIRAKCLVVVLDSGLNSPATVVGTAHKIFLVAALRTCCSVRELRKRSGRKPSADFLTRCVDEAVRFGALLVKSRCRPQYSRTLQLGSTSSNSMTTRPGLGIEHTLACQTDYTRFDEFVRRTHHQELCKSVPSKCFLTFNQISFLGYSAFYSAVRQCNGQFPELLKSLSSKMRMYERKLCEATKVNFAAWIRESGNEKILMCK